MESISQNKGADMFQMLVNSMSIRAGKETNCPKCGAERYINRTFPQFGDRIFRVPISCQCTQNEVDKQRREKEDKEKREKLERMIPYSGHRKMTFEASDEPMKAESRYVSMYMQDGDNLLKPWETFKSSYKGILFTGATGTGKTYSAASIANKLFENDYSVYMANVAEIAAKMGDSFGGGRETMLHYAEKVGLFIIDDFGATRESDFVIQGLYELIDARMESGKQTIVTTNLDLTAMANIEDTRLKRIASRLSTLYPIKKSGQDRRKAKAIDAYKQVKDILGE